MNGLAQASATDEKVGKLALLPVGTGNDFADMIGCPRDLDAAAAMIAAGKVRYVDLGYVQMVTDDGPLERYFDNNLGVGFEAQVTLESYKIKRLSGMTLYIAAALRTLYRSDMSHIHVAWEQADGSQVEQDEQLLLVSIGNSPRTGGGFYLTPDAVLDDGLLDIGVARAVSRWRILQLLIKALAGKHTKDPAVTLSSCRRIFMQSAEQLPVHLDGEVVTQNAHELSIEVQPGRLELIGQSA